MSQTLFWYDLETTGIRPSEDRIMQFAGQRTTLDLEPIGGPVNIMIKLSDDILPSPDAILVTGITPQQTIQEGVTEAEFLRMFDEEIALPGTIFTGFNSVRFDDEFMRYIQFRNFYDPYAWQWKEDRSRWDLLDVVRMTRALRPEGIEWPEKDGVPTNRLELLTKMNSIDHQNAHDALADVTASIAVAKLIREKQPRLFEWLLKLRDKKAVRELVMKGEPFVYSSGKYPTEFQKTTIAMLLAEHPKKQGALVYDLRIDPTPFLAMSAEELADRWRWNRDPEAPPRLPVKTLQFNRCPAVAPYSVVDDTTAERIVIDKNVISTNQSVLIKHPEFIQRVIEALHLLDEEQAGRQRALVPSEGQLYDNFIPKQDETVMRAIRVSNPKELGELHPKLSDARLQDILPLYKARNFPEAMTDEERVDWESYRAKKLLDGGTNSRAAKYFARLGELYQSADDETKFILQELQLYGESILPFAEDQVQ